MVKAIEPISGFKFGCDPELFVFGPDDKPVYAGEFIKGTKEDPFKVERGAVQVDGLAAEFNIDPAETYEEFRDNIAVVLIQLKEMLPPGYELRAVPSVVFDRDVFVSAPPEALALGCQPDFNAWDSKVNPPPEPKDNPFMRTAAGHLHIGWSEGEDTTDSVHVGNCIDLVRQLDWYLGAWSVQHDPDKTRRSLYGRAGACRFKSYGVEYRVLSNFWVFENKYRLAVWNRMQQAIHDMKDRFMPERVTMSHSKLVVENINKSLVASETPIGRAYQYPLQTIAATHRN